MISTCVRCGKQFETKHKTSVCSDCKIQTCVICGTKFELKWPYTSNTCSATCRGKYRQISGIGKLAAKKASDTVKQRYGVSNAANLFLKARKCKYCGKEFIPTSNRQIYCTDIHYGTCPVCGKRVQILDMSIGPTTCSMECRQKQIEATNLKKYGVRNVFQSADTKAKSHQTMLEKYGVDHYSKSDEFRVKFKATSQIRYGTDNPLQSEEIKQKLIKTNQFRYGGNSPMSSQVVRDKSAHTADVNYGGFGMASSKLRQRIESTNLNKYGCRNPAQSKEVRNKIAATCIERYGAKSYFGTDSRLQSVVADPSKFDNYKEFKIDPAAFISSHYDHKPCVFEICRDVGITDTSVYDTLILHNCRDLATFRESSIEHELYEFLKSLDTNLVIIRDDRKQISPYEIDFYLPKHKLGIECNPTLTHNSTFKDPWDGLPKPVKYHQMKSDLATEKGIFLFHIFGYEWTHRKHIIKSMIRNLLIKDICRIYARSTRVEEISHNKAKQFLDKNHRQGYANASIRLGLVDNAGELLSLMTFGKMRSTLGRTSNDTYQYELIRFCSKINTNVIGGASKLFKYFCRNYQHSSIVSFSDVAHTRGNLYSILGFKKIHISDPGYVWVNMKDDTWYNRVQCQKSHIQKLFSDISNDDLERFSEKDLMSSRNYAQVFDSGVIRWEYHDKTM